MPNFLHVMNYRPRGTRTFDHFTLALATEFARRGWAVRFAFAADPPEAFATSLRAVGAAWVVIPFPFTFRSARELIRKLNGIRPDIIQCSFVSAFTPALLWLKLRRYTRRLIVIDHSSGQTPLRSGWRKWLTRLRGRLVGRIVDWVVPVSEVIARRDIERVYLPAKKVRVIYNGIPLDLFPNPPRPPREKVRLCYAGQLIPEKGVFTLLRAYERIRASGVSGCELLLAGKGAQEAELRTHVEEKRLPDVTFLGHVDNMSEFFAASDVVVVPSEWFEAFGLVLAEAMACGAACVVSDAGALSEVVGNAGLVFPAGDDTALAERLIQLVGSAQLRAELSAAGRRRVEQQFTLQRKVESQVALCEAAVNGGRNTILPSGSSHDLNPVGVKGSN